MVDRSVNGRDRSRGSHKDHDEDSLDESRMVEEVTVEDENSNEIPDDIFTSFKPDFCKSPCW